MKKLVLLFLVLVYVPCFAQVTVIETGTKSKIGQINRIGNYILLNGGDTFLAKCYGHCDSIFPLVVPGRREFEVRDVSLVDTNLMFAVSSSLPYYHSQVYKSTDGGYSWQIVFDSMQSYFYVLRMFDSLDGILLGNSYRAILIQNGGDNWIKHSTPCITVGRAIKFKDSTICIGMPGSFCISDDRGQNWKCNGLIQNGPRDIFFLNRDTLVAPTNGTHGIKFSYSFDRCINWKHLPMPTGFEPYGTHFKSINEGYIVGHIGDSAVIVKTTDLGKTWQLFNTGLRSALLDIEFLNDSIALVSGTQGMLFRVNVKEAFPAVAGLGHQEAQSVNISLYPNPTQSTQTLSLENLKPQEQIAIQLLDLSGRVVQQIHSGTSSQAQQQFEINLSALSDGFYLCQIRAGKETSILKVMKY